MQKIAAIEKLENSLCAKGSISTSPAAFKLLARRSKPLPINQKERNMLQWISGVMDSMSYFGIIFLMFMENVFPPIPSELIMPLAGFSTTKGKMSLIGVSIAGMIGSVLGALPIYYLGKTVGERRLKQWADKYGKWLTISGKDIDKSKKWFGKHGSKAVLIGRVVPGVRSLISLPAGMSGMPLVPFLVYSALGTGAWAFVLALLGRILGNNYEKVSRFLGPVSYLILAGLVVAAVMFVMKRKKTMR
jgi:membrane protein DedA with SNARE-associated domain